MLFLKPKIFFTLLFFLCLFLTFNKHSKDKANSYHGVIWSDAAGYYVYNPVWFIYGNDSKAFPDSVETKTGNGFSFSDENKVVTKYPSGVALLQAPFFLASHFLAKPLGYEADGFSRIYSFGLFIAGIFYCCMGLFLISRFLSGHFSTFISIASPLLFLAGTNLFYYSIDAPGMSHVYSFFLFSVIIYLTPEVVKSAGFKTYFLFFSCIILAALTRPTNILIVLFPLFYSVNNKADLFARFRLLMANKLVITSAILLSCIILIPQLIYWYSTTGKLITYSYGNESFVFLTSPKLLEVWFSTNNGLFTYSPLILLSVAGIVLLIINRERSGYLYAGMFLLISYIFASWWCWWFGCSFGARSFIEYYALLSIPFSYLMQKSLKHPTGRIILFVAVAFCCYLNMDMEYYYDGCFYGTEWDIATYFKLLNS
jgi:hypothetical protein